MEMEASRKVGGSCQKQVGRKCEDSAELWREVDSKVVKVDALISTLDDGLCQLHDLVRVPGTRGEPHELNM